jgi:hypothetical protein
VSRINGLLATLGKSPAHNEQGSAQTGAPPELRARRKSNIEHRS